MKVETDFDDISELIQGKNTLVLNTGVLIFTSRHFFT